MDDGAGAEVEGGGERLARCAGQPSTPETGELADVGEGGVGQGEGRGAGVGAGHVGDAVVEDAVDAKDRIVVGGGAAAGGAAALIDGDVDDDRYRVACGAGARGL